MTVQGTISKTFLLLAILMTTAFWSWGAASAGQIKLEVLYIASALTLVLYFVTFLNPRMAAWTAPVYAGIEGVVLGMITFLFNHRFENIAIQAIALTGGVTFLMLFIYVTGIIKVTGQLASAVIAATGAICLIYLATMMLNMFGRTIPYIHEGGAIGIGFSVFVVGLAAFNLLLDFDFIDRSAKAGCSKSMEWYGAFALMVTLAWMYVEILRLLAKINRR